jgi:hypothetical protein
MGKFAIHVAAIVLHVLLQFSAQYAIPLSYYIRAIVILHAPLERSYCHRGLSVAIVLRTVCSATRQQRAYGVFPVCSYMAESAILTVLMALFKVVPFQTHAFSAI